MSNRIRRPIEDSLGVMPTAVILILMYLVGMAFLILKGKS